MSVEAITWALKQPIKHSSAKFILVVMANCANGQSFEAFPSIAYIAESTGQDRKTVIENIKRLLELGYINDTGERKGDTKQIIIYRLNNTENGSIKESRKRDSTENGTVPFFPSNSTAFPVKQYRFSRQTVPKTGHGTVIEPSLNRNGTVNNKSVRVNLELPDWLDPVVWAAYIAHRKGSKFEEYAQKLAIAKLGKMRANGHDPTEVIHETIANGWKGLFEPKTKPGATGLYEKNQAAAKRAKEMIFGEEIDGEASRI